MAELGMEFGFNWENQSDLTLAYGFSSDAGGHGWQHQPGSPGAPNRVPRNDQWAIAVWELSQERNPSGSPVGSSLRLDVTITISWDDDIPQPILGQGWEDDGNGGIKFTHHFDEGEGSNGWSAGLQDHGYKWSLPSQSGRPYFTFNPLLHATEEYSYEVSVRLEAQDPNGNSVTWSVDPTLIIGGQE